MAAGAWRTVMSPQTTASPLTVTTPARKPPGTEIRRRMAALPDGSLCSSFRKAEAMAAFSSRKAAAELFAKGKDPSVASKRAILRSISGILGRRECIMPARRSAREAKESVVPGSAVVSPGVEVSVRVRRKGAVAAGSVGWI